MKKLITVLFAICLIFSLSSAASLHIFAAEKNTVILFDAVEQDDRTILINVDVKENSGVYSMLLTLDYDSTALTLERLSYGDAFSSLEPIATGEYSTVPFKISYLGTGEENDMSIGNMMTLVFSVKENAPDGDYTVTFTYEKNKDVSYLKDGTVKTKNLIVDGTKITLKNNGVKEIAPFPEDSEVHSSESDVDIGVKIGVAVAVTFVILTTVSGFVLVVRKRKGRC